MRTWAVAVWVSLAPLAAHAQESQSIAIGERGRLRSAILGEEREYWVSVPASYSDAAYAPDHYAVLYLLDAEANFHGAAGAMHVMSYAPAVDEHPLARSKERKHMTNSERVVALLTTVNVLLVAANLSQVRPAHAREDTSVLRGRGLELTDAAGRIRAQFNVEPDGEAVFRIRDSSGDIRVKLGGGGDGSGLVLLDETTQPAVHIVARRTARDTRPTTSINLMGEGGQRLKVTPE